MSAEARVARLHRVRKHQRSVAATELRKALHAKEQAQAVAEEMRLARERAEASAREAGKAAQPASDWLAARMLVDARLERERLSDLQVRRLGRQEQLRRVDLRAAMLREEQTKFLGERLAERRERGAQRTEQKVLDDLPRKGGDGK